MVELGDLVREVGGTGDFRVTAYSSARKQFEIRSVNRPIQIKSVNAECLEVVEKAPGSDPAVPCAIPERWITD